MLEHYLIDFCSPTLAKLKVGSLFAYQYDDDRDLDEWLAGMNMALVRKGILMCVLRRTKRTVLIYMYRRSALQQVLDDPEIAAFLARFGYDGHITSCLCNLKKRIRDNGDFPHEIGVFLGYPLEDVIGFMTYRGRNCKCVGTWKVYGDQTAAEKLFRRYTKCRDIYRGLFDQGRSIWQLTVAG